MALILLLAPLLLSGASAETPEAATWGVSYDWELAETDLETMLALDFAQLITDLEGAAADNDFALDVSYDYRGATHLYLTTRDGGRVTVSDADGNLHTATARLTTLTLRHATATSLTLRTDWSDYKAGYDFSLAARAGTTAVIDLTVTEYLTDDGELVGADVTSSGFVAVEASAELGGQANGRSDTLRYDDIRLTATGEFRWSDYASEWRLRQPSPVYNLLAGVADDDNQTLEWDCDEWRSSQQVSSNGGRVALREDCGTFAATFNGSYRYDFQLSNLPADDMGLPVIWEQVRIYDDHTAPYATGDPLSISTDIELYGQRTATLDNTSYELALLTLDTPLPEPLATLVGLAVGDPLDALDEAAGLGTVLDNEINDAEGDYDDDRQIITAIFDDFESSTFGRDYDRFMGDLGEVFDEAAPAQELDDFRLRWLWDRDADGFLMPRATYRDEAGAEHLLAGPVIDDLALTETALVFTHSATARTRQTEVAALRTRGDILGDDIKTDSSGIASAPLLPLLALLAAVAATRRKRLG